METMSNYSAKDLSVLTGLAPVQTRPGMYTDTTNPNHLCQEVVDNCVDEALAGYAKQIDIVIASDNSICVTDDGRGIPADIHPEHKLSGIEIIMTKLHSGAKFSDKSYKFSGGLHGVGISVVNALSVKLEVNVMRQGKKYYMDFANGEKTTELMSEDIAKYKHGTSIKFWPNPKYFDSEQLDISKLKKLFHAKALLCPGLKINFTYNNKTENWVFDGGISSYLEEQLSDVEIISEIVFSHSQKDQQEEFDLAFAWTSEQHHFIRDSYVNLIPTPLGGTHVNGLKQGVFEAVKEFCELHELVPRNILLKPEDTSATLHYILSVKLQEPQFAGQTKERLSNRRCASYVSQITKDKLSLWLNQNTQAATSIAELCIAKAEQRYKKAKKISRKKVTSGPALPGKLADCVCQNREESELFLVEGDSAGGSAKQARDKNFQAILPLRGKILNSWEVESESLLASQTIMDISISIGVDPGCDDISGLRYGKICILADADSDGNHISTLLCALFFKHFRPLVKAGKLYVAMPPLYRIDLGKSVMYALDNEEKQLIIDRNKGKKVTIQRFKGLGEMNPGQLKETTMSSATRRLVQLKLSENDNDILNLLLSKKTSDLRRSWIEEF